MWILLCCINVYVNITARNRLKFSQHKHIKFSGSGINNSDTVSTMGSTLYLGHRKVTEIFIIGQRTVQQPPHGCYSVAIILSGHLKPDICRNQELFGLTVRATMALFR